MSKSTLYKYFASKEDVVVALVEESCLAAETEVERTLDKGNAAEQLQELAAIIGRHGQRLPRAVLVEPERLPPICSERLAMTRSTFADAAHHIVRRGVKESTFRHPAPDVVAVGFVAAALAVLGKAAQSDQPDYATSLAYLPDLFLPSLRA